MESIFDVESISEFNKEIKKLIRRLLLGGMSIVGIYSAIASYCDKNNVPSEYKDIAIKQIENVKSESGKINKNKNVPASVDKKTQSDWRLADTHTLATVYNAVPAQCNGDFGHTASMFRLDLYNVLSHRIIAMERTFMKKLGLKYGDVVKIEGTGKYDGIWQIQDTMNKRFAGQHKIDILVPDNIKKGQWDNVKLYVLKDKSLTDSYKSKLSGQVSVKENKRQVALKKEEMRKQKELKKQQVKNNKKQNKK
jgi:signal peptidase I